MIRPITPFIHAVNASIVLALLVLTMYLGAGLWLAVGAMRRSTSPQGHHIAGLILATVGWLLHGYTLCHAVILGPALALTSADTASLVGWVVATIAIIGCARRNRFDGIGGLLLIASGLSAALTNDGTRDFTLEQHGWKLLSHALLSITAYALIAIGAVLAIALWMLDRRLRSHRPLGWYAALPSIESLESGMFQSLIVGFVLLSFALFSGFVFVENLAQQHLIHKVILSCAAWTALAILFVGHWRYGWRGRSAAGWTLSAFVLLALAYFGTKFVLESVLNRHWG